MRPLYYDNNISGPTDTITQVFDKLEYCPTWFFQEGKIKTIVDIGAMIGSFTLWAHEKWPNAIIHSFEPDPKSFEFLKKNVSSCPDSKKIITHNMAVWNKNSKISLHQFEKTPSCNSIIFSYPPKAIGKHSTIEIKTESISSIINKLNITIDYLKIDCEGAEYDILYSLKKSELKKIRYIAIECHEYDKNEKHNAISLCDFLRKNGFLTQIVPTSDGDLGLGYIYGAQLENNKNIINAIFDGERKRILNYIELPNTLTEKLVKLQNEFDERSKWALELNAQLKETKETLSIKESQLKETKETLSIKESQLKETKETLSIKESQLEDLQRNLYMKQNELEGLKDSILFKMPFKIARGLDRTFPQDTKRGDALRLLRMSLLILQNEGFRALLQASNEKRKRQRFLKKGLFSTIKKNDFLDLSKTDKIHRTSNLIQGIKSNKPDPKLRNFIAHDASNILNLSRFPKVSIIIPTLNQVEFLRRNLSGIEEKTTYKNYEIIVVTNNLDENSAMRKFLKTIKHEVYVFKDEYSFSEVNNFAAKKAEGEFLLFLNDDIEIVFPNWLESMLKLAMQEKVGAVGPKLIFPHGKLQEAGGIVWKDGMIWNHGRNENPKDPRFNFVRDVDYCSASCLMIKKELFEKLGGFNTQYKPAYCEDTDICLSIQKEGFRVLYQPLATLIHHEGKTSGTDLKSGIKAYQNQNQKKFRKKWQQFLNSRLVDTSNNVFLERNRKEGLNILYIDHYVPEYDKDAGSLLVYNMLSILSYLGHKVTFWPDNLVKNEPYVTNLQQKGIEIIYGNNSFESFIKKHKNDFQICITTRAHIAPKYIDWVKKYAPKCKIVYDTVDLHFLREFREAKLKKNSDTYIQAQKTKEIEFGIFQKSDVVIVKSISEANFLLKEDPSLTVSVIPTFQIPPNEFPTYNERKDLLFLGGFQHTPNIDSLEHLIKTLFPKIKEELPNVKLYVIGSNPTQNVIDICTKTKGVVFLGYVKNIDSHLKKCRLLLAPIRYGAGVKGKITQSLAYGLPVVTTPMGAEGISDKSDVLAIGKTDDEFIEKTIAIYNNEELWTKLSLNSKKHSEENFSPEFIKNTLEHIISELTKPK